MKKIPSWISEYITKDIVDSSLFRFNVELQAVEGYRCNKCKKLYSKSIPECEECSGDLSRQYKKITVDLVPDLDLDYDILESQMQDLPAQYAFYAALYSEAKTKVALEDRRLKAIKGSLIEKVQFRSKEEGIKFSADQVKYVVEADDQLKAADARLQLAHKQCGKLYHMVEALKLKAELARSLAGFKRQEQENS